MKPTETTNFLPGRLPTIRRSTCKGCDRKCSFHTLERNDGLHCTKCFNKDVLKNEGFYNPKKPVEVTYMSQGSRLMGKTREELREEVMARVTGQNSYVADEDDAEFVADTDDEEDDESDTKTGDHPESESEAESSSDDSESDGDEEMPELKSDGESEDEEPESESEAGPMISPRVTRGTKRKERDSHGEEFRTKRQKT